MVVVGGLLLAALIVGLVLWVTMGSDDSRGFAPAVSAPADDSEPTVSAGVQAALPLSVRTFDPDGEDGERDELADLVIDNDLTTAWKTVCYGDRFLGGKQGVGLVVDLGVARTGTFTVALGSAPYQLKVYAVGEGDAPTSFPGWGDAVGSFDGQDVEVVAVELVTPARHVLVSFNELGDDDGCSDNPFRGVINEVNIS